MRMAIPVACMSQSSDWRRRRDINLLIWCAVGAALGWGAAIMAGSQQGKSVVENVLVGAFGALIGGEAIPTWLDGPVAGDAGFSVRSLAFAVVGALVLLGLLKLMRRAVGAPGTSKGKRRGPH